MGWSNIFLWLISKADSDKNATYNISTQHLKAFRNYLISKFAIVVVVRLVGRVVGVV